ncbi:hypothetical protein DSH65_07855 [Enterococcus faecalis]|uniref:Uncharacterized protein n=1 Tax=Enterococcus faecalis TaxID=1351 RepID=A0A8B3RRP1_ENTFL|nr:predicted protein [Enterococcus faecalis ATCC 4200]EGO8408260.1 hypothetical protein [Enterococcus faecalis]EGO8418477.1 hypothetical protein [Enterococcus faecalis]EGO8421556.1 hypothetical protein [Enterococcus faecalis]EGO8448201.1 hypothetical protein [Enterococcus faecalis]
MAASGDVWRLGGGGYFAEYRITNTINIKKTRCKFLRNLQRVFVNFKIKNGTIYQKSTVDICTQLR